MKPKTQQRDDELYTYTEFRKNFFPKLPDYSEDYLIHESLMDFLKKVSRPTSRPAVPSRRTKENKGA